MINPRGGGISRSPITLILLGTVVGSIVTGFAVYFLLSQGSPAQQVSHLQKENSTIALEKFKVSGGNENAEWFFLVVQAGEKQGIWERNGLDPEWVSIPRPHSVADLKEQVDSGVKIGFTIPNSAFSARSSGVPIKILASYFGESLVKIFVNGDSRILTLADLDGKKVGLGSNGTFSKQLSYLSNRVGIKPEIVFDRSFANITSEVAALKAGRIDAFMSAEGALLRLVDSGELRIVARVADFEPRPYMSVVIFATEDLIQQNPDLARRFVKATLETIKYLKENPATAADLYIERSGAPADLAEKVISQLDWKPSGKGSGSDLTAAAINTWQFYKDSGAIPPTDSLKIEDVVDTRFLP